MDVTGIDHLVLTVTAFEATCAFYERLGVEVVTFVSLSVSILRVALISVPERYRNATSSSHRQSSPVIDLDSVLVWIDITRLRLTPGSERPHRANLPRSTPDHIVSRAATRYESVLLQSNCRFVAFYRLADVRSRLYALEGEVRRSAEEDPAYAEAKR